MFFLFLWHSVLSRRWIPVHNSFSSLILLVQIDLQSSESWKEQQSALALEVRGWHWLFGSWSEFREFYLLSLSTDAKRQPENTSQQRFVECQDWAFGGIFVERKMNQSFCFKATVSNADINRMFCNLQSHNFALASRISPCQKARPTRVS